MIKYSRTFAGGHMVLSVISIVLLGSYIQVEQREQVAPTAHVVQLADDILKTAETISDLEDRNIVISHAAYLLGRSGETDRARKLFEQALEDDPTIHRLEHVFSNQAWAGFVTDALNEFRKLPKTERSHLDDCLFEIAIALAETKSVQEAVEFIESHDDDYERRWIFAEVAGDLFVNSKGENKHIEFLIEKSLDGIDEAKPQPEWLSPIVSRAVIAITLAKHGMKERGLEIANQAFSDCEDADDLSNVLWAYAECGATEKVRKVVSKMSEHGEELGDDEINNYVIDSLCNANELDKALKLSLESPGKVDDMALGNLAIELANLKRIDEANHVLESITPRKFNSKARLDVVIAIALGKEQQQEAAEWLLKGRGLIAFSLTDSARRSSIRNVSYVYGYLGLNAEWKEWVEKIAKPYDRSMAIVGYAEGLLDRK